VQKKQKIRTYGGLYAIQYAKVVLANKNLLKRETVIFVAGIAELQKILML
jgi:hypothetical protein